MVLERCHSERMSKVVSKIRSQILKYHVSVGKGVDRSLQKAHCQFSSNQATRQQQLHIEYNNRVTNERTGASASESGSGSNRAESMSVVDKFQDTLIESIDSLIVDVRAQSREDERKLWDGQRMRLSQDLAQAKREKARLQEENKKQRERTEYALTLVKAVRPLIKSM